MTAVDALSAMATGSPGEGTAPGILPLRAGDVSSLRIRGARRLSAAAVRALVEQYPDRAVWLPRTAEYVLLAPWRHRPEVAWLQEIAAVANAEALIAAASERSREAGDALTLAVEMDETRRPSFYERAGLSLLEEIVTYELDLTAARLPRAKQTLDFRRVRLVDPGALDALLRLDHAAFPWLWWNAEDEFHAYDETPGVQLFLASRDRRPVAYVGMTTYDGWGHLDRIAVLPEAQGAGLGRATLAFVVATFAAQGARRIALSTQGDNLRSQRLYDRFGFARSPSFDYRLYGAWHRRVGASGGRGVGENDRMSPRRPDSPTPRLETP